MKRDFYIGDQRVLIHRASTETHGSSAIIELHHPNNFSAPLLYHRYEIEHFYVLEGEYSFTIGQTEKRVSTGELVTTTVNTAFRFTALGAEKNRLLVFFTPGGVEKYYELMSYISEDDPDGAEKRAKIENKFGIVIAD
ncbi:MAG: cupin domain-containing protein [Bdellovibrionales bacterium]|nr:cupin domain-containing protein [Bdellovibrionales bacterium]